MHDTPEMATIPAFLAKLWKLVNDPETDDLISWSQNGENFVIHDTVRFTQKLLPMYFKHNNLASFVRQLNMYGFRKVVSIDSGGLKSEKDAMEFCHTYFTRGHSYLMHNIKRKMPVSKNNPPLAFVKELAKDGNDVEQTELLAQILSEVNSLKDKQANWDSKLTIMKRENESLWRELAVFRQKHLKQEKIINRLISFIVRTVSSRNIPLRRPPPLMLNDVERASKASTSPKGPTICELDELLGETSSAKQEEKNQFRSEEYLVPNEEDHEPPYRSEYDVTSPEEVVDMHQQSPWLLSDGSDFDSEAMTPVNPLLINMPNSNFDSLPSDNTLINLPDYNFVENNESNANQQPKNREKRVRKTSPAKKNTSKKSRDILQETMNLINLEPTDLASPGSSGDTFKIEPISVNPETDENQDAESNANILKILQDVASQPAATSQDFAMKNEKPEGAAMSPLNSALAKPVSNFGADHVASELGSHVDTVECDLEALRDILKRENYNLDANLLLELFNDDPMSLLMPQSEKVDTTKEANNELMMYTNPTILDFADVYGTAAAPNQSTSSLPMSPLSPSILDTPVMTPATPGFPSPPKKRRK